MNLIEAISLFSVMVALAALPSSSVALIIARAATLGTANGIAVAVGIVLGDLVFVALAILGMSVVAETLGGFFVLAKIMGGLYLIYMGIKLLKSKPDTLLAPTSAAKSKGLFTSLMAGFLLTLGDVKAILFYASLFPMFIDLSAINAQAITTIVVITVLSVGCVKVAYAVLGSKYASLLLQRKYASASKPAAGVLLVCIGSYVAIKA